MLFWIRQIIFYLVIGLFGVLGTAAFVIWFLFGAGEPYRDITEEPVLPEGALEVVLELNRPIGNAAVSQDGRIFFTIHPEAGSTGTKLYEFSNGEAVPFPSPEAQQTLLQTPLGLEVDDEGTLWVIDPARHGFGQPRLLRFDIDSGETLYVHDLPRDAAPRGSYLQDLAVGPGGDWVYIADTGFWNRSPGIVVVETEFKRAHRMLEGHETTAPKDLLIRNQIRDMSYYRGLVSMKAGVDGIAMPDDGEWLYFSAMTHDSAYRVPPAMLHNPNVDFLTVTVEIETVALKPLSAGIELDAQGNLYITDVEHQAIHRYNPLLGLDTVLRDDRIRWADNLALGPDGALYLADSALPEIFLQDEANHAAAAPYTLWRFTPPRTPEEAEMPGASNALPRDAPVPAIVPAPVVIEE